MRHRIGVALAPGREIAAHHLGIRSLALDARNVVVFQGELYRRLEIALEGEIDVAAVEHERAIDRAGFREAYDQPARPVRERAGTVGPAPDADGRGAPHVDVELGARG